MVDLIIGIFVSFKLIHGMDGNRCRQVSGSEWKTPVDYHEDTKYDRGGQALTRFGRLELCLYGRWSQPIRAQYLSGSGPMRGLHPAWRPPRPWWSQALGGRWTWSCGSPCGPGWLWTSPRTRAPVAGPHTGHTTLAAGTVPSRESR